ncbi:MAG: hypothetical protein EXS15_03800 [Phycisphaerales bacterium]|nr:hypothetical protein [Phycisphaerales bacterium]
MPTLTRLAIGSLVLLTALSVGATQQSKDATQGDAAKAKAQAPKAPKVKRGPGSWYGVEQPPKKSAGAVRIAAYNLLNLFDHVDDPTLDNKWEEETLQVTEDRAQSLAKVIKRLDADVLFLEEIESKAALTWFRDTYLKDMGYTHLESLDAGYYRGVEQSVLSRFPLKNPRVFLDAKLEVAAEKDASDAKEPAAVEGQSATSVPNDPSKFQRSPLAVDVVLPGGYELTVYAIHHKAGGKAFEGHRQAEAVKIIELVQADLAKDANRNLLIMGDFNSTPLSDVMNLYRDEGFATGYDFRPSADRIKQKDSKLPDAERDALRDKYTTHESGRPIDYIMMSSGFVNEVVADSFFILSTLHPSEEYNYKTDQPPAGYASDHYPIAIDFMPHDTTQQKGKSKSAKAAASPR